jgi:hypothetical protein
MFAEDGLYYGLVAVDLALRISWVYKLSADLRHARWFVLVMTLLEVGRRFLWTFVRLENELRKIEGRSAGLGPLIPTRHGSSRDRRTAGKLHTLEERLTAIAQEA